MSVFVSLSGDPGIGLLPLRRGITRLAGVHDVQELGEERGLIERLRILLSLPIVQRPTSAGSSSPMRVISTGGQDSPSAAGVQPAAAHPLAGRWVRVGRTQGSDCFERPHLLVSRDLGGSFCICNENVLEFCLSEVALINDTAVPFQDRLNCVYDPGLVGIVAFECL